jgi:hypothetical protein
MPRIGRNRLAHFWKSKDREQNVKQARLALGKDAFAATWEEGHNMTWEHAVNHTIENTPIA